MISNDYTRLALDKIFVNREKRQRRELDLEKGGLLASIAKRGVLQPIIVRRPQAGGKAELVVGERRYSCSLNLALPDIPVRFMDELDPIELQIVELEENIHRVNLTWQDFVRGVSDIHRLYKSVSVGQTQTQTGEAIGLSEGLVSQYCAIAEAIDDPVINRAGTAREAYNILSRRRQREHGDMLEQVLSVGEDEPKEEESSVGAGTMVQFANERDVIGLPVLIPASAMVARASPVLCTDFLHWAPRYIGPKFNLIHCDFPYGVGLFGSSGQRTGDARSQMGRDTEEAVYDDSPETYRALVECLCTNINRIMSVSGHLMFWFSNQCEIEQWTRRTFATMCPDLKFTRFPLVWWKSDNAGIAAVPTMEPRHVYETALLASRGGRQVVKVVADCYGAPTLRSSGTTIKPPNVLRHFFSMLIDEHSRVLDPTCGSGSALVAAEALGAQVVLGLELDPDRAEIAGKLVGEERRKREAALAHGGRGLDELLG